MQNSFHITVEFPCKDFFSYISSPHFRNFSFRFTNDQRYTKNSTILQNFHLQSSRVRLNIARCCQTFPALFPVVLVYQRTVEYFSCFSNARCVVKSIVIRVTELLDCVIERSLQLTSKCCFDVTRHV